MSRPSVSVVVPFKGDAQDAARVVAQLDGLRAQPGDEFTIVDNSPIAVVGSTERVSVVRAALRASSYYARNAGASAAGNEWMLFVDSDCLLPATLIDDYFDGESIEPSAIVAGELVAAPGQASTIAAYERSRHHLEVAQHMEMGPGPAGITANLLVRRSVWDQLGGFHEVRSGADLEFCWRAIESGRTVSFRPEARVEHLHCETLSALLRKAKRYGPGQSWVNRRFPGSSPAPDLGAQLIRAVGGAAVWTVTLRFRRALYKVLDGLWTAALAAGYWGGDNRASNPQRDGRAVPTMDIAAEFPPREPPSEVPPPLVLSLRRGQRAVPTVESAPRVEYIEDWSTGMLLCGACALAFARPMRFIAAWRSITGGLTRLQFLASVRIVTALGARVLRPTDGESAELCQLLSRASRAPVADGRGSDSALADHERDRTQEELDVAPKGPGRDV